MVGVMGMPCPVSNIQFAIIQEISLFVLMSRLYMFLIERTKPSPNESTTPVLKARGTRRAAHDPGSPVLCRVSSVWIGLSNPRFLAIGRRTLLLGPS